MKHAAMVIVILAMGAGFLLYPGIKTAQSPAQNTVISIIPLSDTRNDIDTTAIRTAIKESVTMAGGITVIDVQAEMSNMLSNSLSCTESLGTATVLRFPAYIILPAVIGSGKNLYASCKVLSTSSYRIISIINEPCRAPAELNAAFRKAAQKISFKSSSVTSNAADTVLVFMPRPSSGRNASNSARTVERLVLSSAKGTLQERSELAPIFDIQRIMQGYDDGNRSSVAPAGCILIADCREGDMSSVTLKAFNPAQCRIADIAFAEGKTPAEAALLIAPHVDRLIAACRADSTVTSKHHIRVMHSRDASGYTADMLADAVEKSLITAGMAPVSDMQTLEAYFQEERLQNSGAFAAAPISTSGLPAADIMLTCSVSDSRNAVIKFITVETGKIILTIERKLPASQPVNYQATADSIVQEVQQRRILQ